MRTLGDALVFFGAAAASALPIGLCTAVLGYPREGLLMAAPLVIFVCVAGLYIKKQKSGMRRGNLATWAVARVTLWPTIAWNYSRHLLGERLYYDEVHPGVFVGGAPWGLMAEGFITKHGVRTVVNCCEEFSGPETLYRLRGVAQVRLHCIDYCDVPLDKIVHAVEQIHAALQERGGAVYIHCKAGKGRAVTVATAYLAKYRFQGNTEAANARIKEARPTAIGTTYQRPAMIDFAENYCTKAELPPEVVQG